MHQRRYYHSVRHIRGSNSLLPFHNGCSKVGSAEMGFSCVCLFWRGERSRLPGLRAKGGLSFGGISTGSPAGREDRGERGEGVFEIGGVSRE